jgi:prepilin peptidase CpaA
VLEIRSRPVMFALSPPSWLLVLVVGLFTTAAAVWDWRYWRIPNNLTLPTFALGLLYQVLFYGLPGLADAGLGFLCGFGVLFVLWLVGGGGAGDVKLMGALSVWLGLRQTLLVLVVSIVMVILGTAAILLWSVMTGGLRQTQQRYLAADRSSRTTEQAAGQEGIEERPTRRVMGYAVPVAIATWLVMLLQLPTLP